VQSDCWQVLTGSVAEERRRCDHSVRFRLSFDVQGAGHLCKVRNKQKHK
jgi:hypothetical protein